MEVGHHCVAPLPPHLHRLMSCNAGDGSSHSEGQSKWAKSEDEKLKKGVREHGHDWDKVIRGCKSIRCYDVLMTALLMQQVSWVVGTKTPLQCQQRWKKVLKVGSTRNEYERQLCLTISCVALLQQPGLVKGPWTAEEDSVVIEMVERYGVGKVKWSDIAARLPGRIGKQCRERWFNHLDPSINKSAWTPEEDQQLFELQQKIGNKWCEISKYLPGRSENAVKNRWNSSARKKWYKSLGLDDPLANKGKSSRK